MKFSLVLATVGRQKEVEQFLIDLIKQSYQDYELILVDQNEDDRVKALLDYYQDKITKVIYIRTNRKGASRARNLGLEKISGDIVGFPDDDCAYASDVLEKIYGLFRDGLYDGITGCHVESLKDGSYKRRKYIGLNIYNLWTRGILFVVFLKRSVVNYVGGFDEVLGVGSGTPFGSGEETDYLIRVIKCGFKMANFNDVLIQHHRAFFNQPHRAFSYSVGRRYILEKYKYHYLFILANVWYPFLKLLCNFYNVKKVKYYWFQFLGRLKFFQKENKI